MANFIQEYINSNKKHLKDYRDYLKDNDWSYTKDIEHAKKEWSVQSTIIGSVITDLKYFVKKAEAAIEYQYVQDFINIMIDSVNIYNKRCEVYMSLNNWTKEQNNDKKTDLLKFFDKLRREITSNNDDIRSLDLEFDVNNLGVKLHGDKKIPFLMRDMMETMFPQLIDARNEYHNIA